MTSPTALYALPLILALAACHAAPNESSGVPGDRSDTRPFAEIAPGEALRFSGTEPFWGGEVTGGALTYKTVDNQAGVSVPVSRFAGRGGLSFSGQLAGKEFTLAITPGDCSDGMSDRVYPFVATLQHGDEARSGCAWSDKHPFKGPQKP